MIAIYKLLILVFPTLIASAETNPVCSEGDQTAECIQRLSPDDGGESDYFRTTLDGISALEDELRQTICSDLERKYARHGQLTKGGRKSVCDNKCDVEGISCEEFSARDSWFGSESVMDDTTEQDVPSAETIAADEKLGRAVCTKLRSAYVKNGFISTSERVQLCKYACSGFPIDCSIKHYNYESYDFMNKFEKWTGRLLSGEIKIGKDAEIITEGMMEAWYSMSMGNLAIFFSVIPVLLNQWKYYNYWTAIAVCFAYALLHLFITFGTAITVHNFGIAILCAVVPAGSPILAEGFIGMTIQLSIVAASFTTDFASQVMLFTLGFVGYFVAIYYCFFIRRQGANAGIIILILQAYVMAERIEYAREMFGITTNAQVIFEMSFNAIFPLGESRYFGKNALDIALRIMEFINIGGMVHIQVTLLVLAQVIMLLAFRAALGTFYIHSLRYSLDTGSIARGFWIYMIDAFGPFRALWRIALTYETMNARRMMYGLVGIVALWAELRGAYGLFCLRIACSLLDMIFIRTTLGKAMHYLEFNVDFMQAAYSQDGAPPYVGLETINAIAANVGIVFVDNSGRAKRGMGVLLKSANRTMLYSVKHVVERAKMITFMNQSTSDPDFRTIGFGDDPIMAMKYEADAVEIDMLSQDEAHDVQQLIFVNVVIGEKWKVLDRVICVVPNFGVRNGRLHASVNLRKGDSGGPCFAVLSDGTVRFCGVVSQGNPRGGGGNIVSICYASDKLGGNSSDEDSIGHGCTPRQFNRVRRNDFASQDMERKRYADAHNLGKLLVHYQATWNYSAGCKGAFLSWDDVRDPDQAAEDYYHDYIDRTRRGDDDADNNNDDGGDENVLPDGKQKRKKDQKRRNKDKAARKRNHYNHAMRCTLLRENLTNVYSDMDAENIYKAITLSGVVPELDDNLYINYAEGHNFILGEELPDLMWS